MANLPETIETNLYRIILLASAGTKLLVIPENGRLRLPMLRVPQYQRLAANLTALLEAEWSQQAVCLFSLDPTLAAPGLRYQVTESCENDPPNAEGSCWVSIGSLEESQFHETADYAAVAKAVAECQDHSGGRKHGTFARLGWFSELTAWVREEAAREGLALNGCFSQLNASSSFSLVRFETNGAALWFKAVGEPNLREYPMTLALRKYFPAFVPEVLATRAEWNGWLSVEAQGMHPDEGSPLSVWTTVAATLADLQIASMGRTLHLADAGCRDARASALAEAVGPFLDVMTELMEQQTKQPPRPLSREELLALRAQLRDLLCDLQDSEILQTLGHLDFNPGNIVISPDRCVFLDWSEACIGHPFVTFQYLLEHFRRFPGLGSSGESALTEAYVEKWRPFLSPPEISRALAISPVLAVLAYAICGDAWRDAPRRHHPTVDRQLRSLTRRMKREADRWLSSPSHKGTPCLG